MKRADVQRQEATIEYDPKQTNREALAKAIEAGTDFKVSVPAGA